MGIAAIDVEAMTTATIMTVGARIRCPRMQEHCRGSGVVPEPDKQLAMGKVSGGGGHGPNLLGKPKVGGGSLVWTQRPLNSYVKLLGDILPLAEIFHIGRVKSLGFPFGRENLLQCL